MKGIYFVFLFLLVLSMGAKVQGQGNVVGSGPQPDFMALGIYIEDGLVPMESRSIMETKLQQIATANGISDLGNLSRFILVPKISVIGKEVLSTAPIQVVLSLEVTLCIGDAQTSHMYATKSFLVKGVGRNINKAYIAALKTISPKNAGVINFITQGKQKIIDYYNTNCDLILRQVDRFESQEKYEQALALLVNVPVQSNCFSQVRSDLQRVYKQVIDRQCAKYLMSAKAIWTANQDINAANRAGALLARVEPNASCYGEVEYLFEQIGNRVKVISDRPWEYKLKVLDARISQAEGAMEVLRIFAKNQPNYVGYNIGGWFR